MTITQNQKNHLPLALMSLQKHGYVCLSGTTPDMLSDVIAHLGTVIMVTDVRPKPAAKSLVCSRRGLDLHTDHHRAAYVAWHCLRQCENGGESLLCNARAVFDALDNKTQKVLSTIFLFEHCIFTGDKPSRPLISLEHGEVNCYYSFWLIRDGLSATQWKALHTFRGAIKSREFEIKLRQGDMLIVDNRRMLHGRKAINENQERFLKRYWIEDRINNRGDISHANHYAS